MDSENYGESGISWRPIIAVSAVLLIVVGVVGYLLFFQGGIFVGEGETGDTAQYREIVNTFKKIDVNAIVGSEFYQNAVKIGMYKIEIPAIQLGNNNPFGL